MPPRALQALPWPRGSLPGLEARSGTGQLYTESCEILLLGVSSSPGSCTEAQALDLGPRRSHVGQPDLLTWPQTLPGL